MKPVIWIHEDALRSDHPVFDTAPDKADVIFIWDSDDFYDRAYSLKRLVFLHECLQELTLTLYHGDTETVLRELSPDILFVPETPDPKRKAIIERLSEDMKVDVIAETPLTDVPANTDMGRFFRFWNRAKKSAMRPTDESPSS